MSNAETYLRFLVEEIHTTVVATVDDDGLPVTAAIDMMDSDGNSLLFLTAKGKSFYDRLKKRQFLALTAMKGKDTLSSVAISIRGKVRELGFEKIQELFKKKSLYAGDIPDGRIHAGSDRVSNLRGQRRVV